MKLIKICLSLLITISMISIDLVNALNDDFEYELLDNGTIEIQGYDGEDTSITVPSKIDGISVTSIGQDAFYCCDTLTTIKIPNGIKSIGSSAFSDCTSLEN
ncbi:leucine-rich repeat protein, partial [Romboutsia ilealis]|uniref:leucine-rich repeat protein n=1 Tax=Romboutsia ilealis TaxID=1115758 RepID=UPI0027299648